MAKPQPNPENNSLETTPPSDGGATPTNGNRKTVMFGLLAVAVVAAGFFGFRSFAWGQHHVATDDAQFASDIVQIAPQVSGTVVKVHVTDNQLVKKGDLLVELDSASYETAFANAQANLALAEAQLKSAQEVTKLTGETGSAQVDAAQGVVSQSEGGVGTAIADVSRARAAAAAAKAQVATSKANLAGANAGYASSVAALSRSQNATTSAIAALETSQSAVRTARAQVRSQEAIAVRAKKEADRLHQLFEQGAIAAQTNDNAIAAAQSAQANLEGLQQQVQQAESVVKQRQADVESSRSAIVAARAAVEQSRAQIAAAEGQVSAANESVLQYAAAQQSAVSNVGVAKAKIAQSEGQLAQAKTVPQQLDVNRANEAQAAARVEQAKAALHDAEINVGRTKIYANIDGFVSKRSVQEGALVTVGSNLITLVRTGTPWVIANFKETQLEGVKPGQEAEVEVDAFPGRVYKAKVDSVSAGTGASFALLPPDNATGNFTKVVQRVPLKIVIEPGQPGLEDLRVGMSVGATIVK